MRYQTDNLLKKIRRLEARLTFEEALQVCILELESNVNAAEKVGGEFWKGAAHASGAIISMLRHFKENGSCFRTGAMTERWKRDEMPMAKWETA